MKKFLASILALVMILSVSASSLAAEITPAPSSHSTNSATSVNLIDPVLFQKAEAAFQENIQERAALFGLTLKNRDLIGQRFYSDEPFLVDSIEGPMSIGPDLTFETTAKAGADGELGVSKGLISATFGVDFSVTETVTRHYVFDPIPAGKFLVYKCYVLYNVYEFEVYSGSEYLGTGKYWTPVGIHLEHDLV